MTPRSLLSLLVALATLLPAAVWADDDEKPPDWIPPDHGKWDWLQLTSGEWVKGEMEGLRDRKVRFDSDKLDDLEIDWEDIQAMYLRKPHTYRLENDDYLQGKGVLRDGRLTVTGEEGVRSAPREEIVAIIVGDGSELDYWSAYVGVDYSYSSGNTDQTDLSGRAGWRREDPYTRWTADYRGLYSEQENDQIAQNHRASTRLDVYITSRLYVITPIVEYYRDEFQNLEHRATQGLAVGYEFVRNGWSELDAYVGFAHQYTVFDEVSSPDDDDTAHDGTVLAGFTYDLDLPRDIEIDNSYRLYLVATDLDKTSHQWQTIASMDVWGPLDLDVTFMLDRIEKPEKDSDGQRPSRNDIRVMAGLSIDW